jgi:imidazolonepropionase
MLIHSASQLLTLTPEPQRGTALGDLGLIPDGAVLIRGEEIAAVGTTAELRAAYPGEPEYDAGGRVVMPGFVDPHTHLIWAGDRAREFEMRLQGKTYLEILAAGGGILSTVNATRGADLETILAQTQQRAASLFHHGVTTAEAKTGYGLEIAAELRLLQGLLELDNSSPLEVVPTFLGAHAIPPEFQGDSQGYADLICDEMLPQTLEWWRGHAAGRPLPFVDVFCETGAFSLEQSRQILETARVLGFPLKIHADEFDNLGGARLAAELGAVSADHLVKTSTDDITALAAGQTVAVALPCTPFGLGEPHYTPARQILEAGGTLAIASDINPGTAWCENFQFVIALACRALKLTPAEAIAAGTINAAAAIGRAGRIGSLHPGKQADLLVLSVADFRHLGYRFGTNLVSQVVKKGRFYPV